MGELQFQLLHLWGFLSGTHVNGRSIILRYLFLFILLFYSLYRFQFFWFSPKGCDTIFSFWFCYDQQHIVFLMRQFILQLYLCVLFEFSYADDCITFNGINTKDFIFLVSLWFLSPSAVIYNLLCLSAKVLNPVASP